MLTTGDMMNTKDILDSIAALPIDDRIAAINELRLAIHAISPFRDEPVDCVQWVKCDSVHSNDYNPNSVAPPEMELLRHSIMTDGYTQPIVTFPRDDLREVVDGFHRNRVGKECQDVHMRVHGYLPVVTIKESQEGKNDRMASTIRHNRARGKHKIESMSEIVVELKRRFWSDEKIAKELGMESDEVLRLQQITGLAGLFEDREFSEAWEAESFTGDDEIEEIQESVSPLGEVRGISEQYVEGNTVRVEAGDARQLRLVND